MKIMNRTKKALSLRFFSGFLALILLTLLLPSHQLMAKGLEKEEVVYGKLNTDGSVSKVYVVNAFNLSDKTMIVDSGQYTDLLNLTNTNDMNYKNGELVVNADKGRFYYQGELQSNELPWLITLRYWLDGQLTDAASLSGQSGKLDMQIKIDRNPNVEPLFFENYALQISMTVNAEKAQKIVAEEATVANAGADKVLNWMLLPNQTADYKLTADISNFSMPGLQISGVPLNMKFEMPDLSQYTGDFAKLHTAVSELNSGAQKLQEGANQLHTGASDSAAGAARLASNSGKIVSGLGELKSGIERYAGGVSEYVDGVTKLGNGGDELLSGFRLFSGGLSELSNNGDTLTGYSSDIASGLSQMAKGLAGGKTPSEDTAKQLGELAKGSQSFYEGLKQLSEQFGLLVKPLKDSASGLNTLATNLDAASKSLAEITAGYEQINVNLSTLVNGINIPTPLSAEDWITKTGADASNADVQKIAGAAAAASSQTATQMTTLKQGLGSMLQTYQTTTSGLSKASGGFTEIAKNITTLSAVFTEMAANIEKLHGALSTAADSYKQINQGISMLTGSLEQLPTLISGLTKLSKDYASFDAGLKEYVGGLHTLSGKSSKIDEGITALNGGIQDLKSAGTEIKNGSGALSSGAGEAASGVSQYGEGVQKLADGLMQYETGVKTYAAGVKELADGTDTFEKSLEGMDKELENKINDEIKKFAGGDFTLKSFVSDKNKDIKAVQFVLMTAEIPAPPKSLTVEQEATSKSFWDKVKSLFE